MKVRFKKSWMGYQKGRIVTFQANEMIVGMLIEKGIVEPLSLNTQMKNIKTK